MGDNLRHWNALAKTDPAHTKPFKRAGGFSGTAIKPIWSAKMMTKHFGPCGIGWGMQAPQFETVPVGDEILVYCTVELWYRDLETPMVENEYGGASRPSVYGVGGDKVAVKRQSGVVADDEAFKKAYTDALSNAMKQIGVGADVHMGLFDDAKYVNEMRQEFAEDDAPAGADVKVYGQKDKPAPNAKSARAVTEAHAGRFELLFPNGELLAKFDTPNAWCEGLRDAINQPGMQILGLWEMNKPLALSIEERFPEITREVKGKKYHAIPILEGLVEKMTSGIAA